MVRSSDEPIIVVAPNYRVNVFGFLGSKALAMRSQDGSTGNYGIQDQRLALQWVRNHISAFGGKGNDVTIFGESAGGNSVLHHLVQPASFGLYEKAIIESGTYDAGYSLEAAEDIYSAFVKETGCANDDLECLLSLRTSVLEPLGNKLRFSSYCPAWCHWGPVVDGVSMTNTPQKLIAEGKFNNKVPVIIGSNRDEFATFILRPSQDFHADYPSNMTEAQFDTLLSRDLSTQSIEMVKRLYDPSQYAYPKHQGGLTAGKSSWWWTAMRVATDNGISAKGWPIGVALGHCSARRIAHQLLKGGTSSVYMYNFQKELDNPSLVLHGMELPFVFSKRVLLGESHGNKKLAIAMTDYWARFAGFGNPNLGGSQKHLPDWPAFSLEGDRSNIVFDSNLLSARITVDHDFRGAACDFWDVLAAQKSAQSQMISV